MPAKVPDLSLAQTPSLGRDLPLAIRQQWPRGSLENVPILGGHEYKIDIIRADLYRQVVNLVRDGHLKLDNKGITHLACLASEGERNDTPRYETSQKDGKPILIASNYWRAKYHGDLAAGIDYVLRMLSEPVKSWDEPLKPSKAFLKLAERLKQLATAGHPVILTPVLSKHEAAVTEENELNGIHHNAIPRAMAIVIKNMLKDARVESSIQGDDGRNVFYKMYSVGRTKASRAERITHQPNFMGENGVQPDANYLILDDHLTAAGTIAQLTSMIIEHGGKVIGALSLAKGQNNGTQLRSHKDMLTLMESTFGREAFGFLHERIFGAPLFYAEGNINPYTCRFTNGELEILFELACSHSNYKRLCTSRKASINYDIPGEIPVHKMRRMLTERPAGPGVEHYFFKEVVRALEVALERSYVPPQADIMSVGDARDLAVGMVQDRMQISRPKDVRDAVKWMLDPNNPIDPSPNKAIGVLTNDICMRLGQDHFDRLTRLIYEVEHAKDADWTKRQLVALSYLLDSVDLHVINNRPKAQPLCQADIVNDARTEDGALIGGLASGKMFSVVWAEVQEYVAERRIKEEEQGSTQSVVEWQMPLERRVNSPIEVGTDAARADAQEADVVRMGVAAGQKRPGTIPGAIAAQKAVTGPKEGVGAPK